MASTEKPVVVGFLKWGLLALLLLALLGAAALLSPGAGPVTATGGNTILSIDSTSGATVNHAADVGHDGNPVLAYTNGAGELRILFCGDLTCSSGNFTASPDPGVTGVGYQSFTFDSNGHPVVSYRANVAINDLKVLHCGNPTCTSGNVIASPDTGLAGWTSIVLDSSGNPVVSYLEGGFLKVLHCGNSTCTGGNVITSPSGVNFGSTSLVLDSDGNPVIAYRIGDNLAILHCGDPTCTAGNTIAQPDGGFHGSLALDAAGNPIVGYSGIPDDKLRVLHCATPNCTLGGSTALLDPAATRQWLPDLVLDAAGNPVISYWDETNDDLKVVHCGNPDCSAGNQITSPDTGADIGNGSSIVLTQDGKPVVSYVKTSPGGSSNTVKLLICGDPNCTGEKGAADHLADLGNPADETFHNLQGWGDAIGPPDNPYVSPSGDDTKRYQLLRADNSVDLFVTQANQPHTLATEVEDGFCDDSFDIFVNGQGPVYTYRADPTVAEVVKRHEVLLPATLITSTTVTVTFQNMATDQCGQAAVYNVGLTPAPSPPSSDLAITKTDSPDPVVRESKLTYTIEVTNQGPDPASNVLISDFLPAPMTFLSGTWEVADTAEGGECGYGFSQVTCDVGDLASGAVATATLQVGPVFAGFDQPAEQICNTASVQSASDDPDAPNNESETCTTVTSPSAADSHRKVVFIQGIHSCAQEPWDGEACDPDFGASVEVNRVQWMVDYLQQEWVSHTAPLDSDDFHYFSYRDYAVGDESFREPVYDQSETCDGIALTYSDKLSELVQYLIGQDPNVEIDIVGHSMGGVVAAYWASLNRNVAQQHVHSVVTFDSPLRGVPHENQKVLASLGPCELAGLSIQDLDDDSAVIDVASSGGSLVPLFTLDATQNEAGGEAVPGDRSQVDGQVAHCRVDDDHSGIWEHDPQNLPSGASATCENLVSTLKDRFVACGVTGTVVCSRRQSSSTFLQQGQVFETTFNMPSDSAAGGVRASWVGSTVDMVLVAPDGTLIAPGTGDPSVEHAKGMTFETYNIDQPQPGTWTVRVIGRDLPPGGEDILVEMGSEPSGAVGGIAELPEVVAAPLEAESSSGASVGLWLGMAAGVVAAAVSVSAIAWYARRR